MIVALGQLDGRWMLLSENARFHKGIFTFLKLNLQSYTLLIRGSKTNADGFV